MIALDSSVLIDLLADGRNAEAAESMVRDALARGPVGICDIVVTEVCCSFGQGEEVMQAIESMGISYSPVSRAAAILAGEMQKAYRDRGGRRERTVPDFIVGAHAMVQCSGLITRDEGFFRDYFSGLKVISRDSGSI